MEMSMTSIDNTAHYLTETSQTTREIPTMGLPVRSGALLSGIDRFALSLTTVMALGPLAMPAFSALVLGA
jgi:hypothetical protein